MRGMKTVGPGVLSRASGRAFTLIEMMVGVAAVAIVAVGLAAIFDSVGKTVAGGRRVSVMNTYASLMESQLRRDFENMANDGFMIIRNQWVDVNNDGRMTTADDVVPLFEGQLAPDRKPRRIDEIQFGVSGRYESARQPLIPGVRATSSEALVYIGHGQRAAMNTTLDANNFKKDRPFVGDFNNTDPNVRLGLPSATGTPNPNELCGDWTLLRHVTLLVNADAAQTQPVPLAAGATVFGRNPASPADYPLFRNRNTQYFLQPAQASVFRSKANYYPLMGGGPATNDPDYTLRRYSLGLVGSTNNTAEAYPLRSSGVVDIASDSFADIRAMVSTANMDPSAVNATNEPYPDRQMLPVANLGGADLDLAIAWMNDAMPTDSRNERAIADRISNGSGERLVAPGSTGYRLRYEPGPTDLLPAISMTGTGGNPALDRSLARADQLMLTASNFVPHCTNFIVEWSFGSMDATGKVLWYGLNDPTTAAGAAVHPYGVDNQGLYFVRYNMDPAVAPHPITPRLIYGVPGAPNVPDERAAELTAYFGYTDPTFAPSAGQIPIPFPHRSTNAVMDWLWPKMVRVRITLADPNNLADEREFTYVFNVPVERAVVRRD